MDSTLSLNEEIDLRVKALVKPECLLQDPPPPPITDLVYPQFAASIASSYNAPVKMENNWGVYDTERKLRLYGDSWLYKSSVQTNAPAGSVIPILEGGVIKYFGRQHFKSAFNADYESRYYKSSDGVSWVNTFLDRTVQGEDSNLIQSASTGAVWNFIRPSRIRDLAVQTLRTDVSNNKLPSGMSYLIFRNTDLSFGRDVYCACPIIVEDGAFPKFLLFVSLYRKGNLGQDVEQLPPYSPDEHTVDGYLYLYDPVYDIIKILNNGLPIIARQGGQQQSYNWATLWKDTIYLNHSSCMNKHVMSQPQTLTSQIYTWKLSDAVKFIK